jgi:hypothetical protein
VASFPLSLLSLAGTAVIAVVAIARFPFRVRGNFVPEAITLAVGLLGPVGWHAGKRIRYELEWLTANYEAIRRDADLLMARSRSNDSVVPSDVPSSFDALGAYNLSVMPHSVSFCTDGWNPCNGIQIVAPAENAPEPGYRMRIRRLSERVFRFEHVQCSRVLCCLTRSCRLTAAADAGRKCIVRGIAP